MMPRIEPGALLLVDRIVETKEGDVIIARINDELCVKKLHIESNGDHRTNAAAQVSAKCERTLSAVAAYYVYRETLARLVLLKVPFKSKVIDLRI